ncbi:FecR family protein [Mariniflexile sp.]|uniref:FecR family protein n=2 Tax=Mariniflexile sp. TaxID=1979402 RepID=UPI004048A4F6
MNDIFNISKLIIKKKLKLLNDSEKAQLKKFNRDYPFSEAIDFAKITQKISDYSTINKQKAWETILLKSEKNQKKRRVSKFKQSWFKYAAVLLVFLSLGYLYQQGYFSKQSILIIPSEQITLQIDNGTTKIINKDESTQLVDSNGKIVGNQVGKRLLYEKGLAEEELLYNTLTVPYGQRFEVQLSDGTSIMLNAGSSLKYPVNFIKGENRQVFLKGEAFFNVAKDATHPFIVNANEIDVRVLGTKFNISSYPEDENINTVLVEGSVSTYKNGDTYLSETATLLKPGYKAAWHKKNKVVEVGKTDIETHIAWMDGRLILYEVAFNDILKKLERQYNVTFINNNKSLEGRYFTAKFDIENIYQVVQSLSFSGNFTYKFNEDKIIINP